MTTAYHDAIRQCAERYQSMEFEDDTLRAFITELRVATLAGVPIPKLCRWLGYIQGVLIERNITTVEIERDWTRPLFRPLDFPSQGIHE